MRTIPTTILLLMLVAASASAQLSEEVFKLKKSQELYDERGYLQGSAVSVDGKLMVSGANGTVSYSYPIASTTVSGYPLTVSLNYAGSVAFTAYKAYASGVTNEAYARWSKFVQNRPAWIIGCCGFAVQMLSANGMFHCDPAKFVGTHWSFDDGDLIYMADGYDVCNRMEDIAADEHEEASVHGYTDIISLLREDGSVLQLYNKHSFELGNAASNRPELFSGHYFVPEANSHAYAVVDYDTVNWKPEAKVLVDSVSGGTNRYRFMPRVLRYYDGSGLEYFFREYPIPYGMRAYRGAGLGLVDAYGAMTAAPTIFYLESVWSNSGPVVRDIFRSRHFFPRAWRDTLGTDVWKPLPSLPPQIDTTIGRALVTDIDGIHFDYGSNALTVEAFGRTTKVRFNQVRRNGNAANSEAMPLAEYGYFTPTAQALATLDETGVGSGALYHSFLGYVTDIIDPEGRKTTFDYETYTRTFVNYNFPFTNPVGGFTQQTVSTKNLRLKQVTEPLSKYAISYARGDVAFGGPQMREDTVREAKLLSAYGPSDDDFRHYPFLTSNVASVVRKYDRANTLMTETEYVFKHEPGESFREGVIRVRDAITDRVHTTSTSYRWHQLPDSIRWVPRPRFTEMFLAADSAEVLTHVATYYAEMPESPYYWLPVADTTVTAGLIRARTNYAYTFDTARTFGGKTSLAALLGLEVKRKITTTMDPATNRPLLVDTADFVHILPIDTTLTRLDTLIDKRTMMVKYWELRDSGTISVPWEWAMYDPRILTFTLDSVAGHNTLPPRYGLLSREVVADSSGTILGGKAMAYSTPPMSTPYLNDLMHRGRLIGDTVIGRNGRRQFATATAYTQESGMNLPSMVTNAIGARKNLYYSAYNSLALYKGGQFRPMATRLYDDDSRHDSLLLYNAFFSRLFAKPLVDESHVRRYDPATGVQHEDTLLRLFQYTFHGVAQGTVDYNGNWTSADYDRNGRLKTLWAPGDMIRRDSVDTTHYQATEEIGIVGYTFRHYRIDTVDCEHGGVIGDGNIFDRDLQNLYAGHNATVIPDCPASAPRIREKDNHQTIQSDELPSLPFVAEDYFDGRVLYTVDSSSALLAATSLDSAYLRLHVTNVTGECVALTVTVRKAGGPDWLAKTYVFNCGEDPDANNMARDKHPGRSMQTSEDGTGFDMKVDLSSIKSQLLAMNLNEGLHFILTVSAPDASIEFVSGGSAEDTRPTLILVGEFNRPTVHTDYTLAYDYDDDSLRATMTAKVDDARHAAAKLAPNTIRRTSATYRFGADGRVLSAAMPVVENGSSRTDSIHYRYNGAGAKLRVEDQLGDTTGTVYDALGRPAEMFDAEGNPVRMEYTTGTQASFSIDSADQYFHGFCERVTTTDQNARHTYKYTDAFGRLRREVAALQEGDGDVYLVTRYEYDIQGQLTTVINPKGDTTRYAYDDFGRVKYKSQPDIGTIAYAYDLLGNVRFVQTAKQAGKNLLGYSEYDDLGRLVLMGEADLSGGSYNEDDLNPEFNQLKTRKQGGARMQSWEDQYDGLLTNQLDPNRLHTGSDTTLLTANKTIWLTPEKGIPSFSSTWDTTSCEQFPADSVMLGEHDAPTGPFLVHAVQFYQSPGGTDADTTDFEHIAAHPEFPRTAIAYDTLPAVQGAVWGQFPDHGQWAALAPSGAIRNQKGREAAVAYRDRGSEPFHYVVLSYDERGRVEALLRYTENLGFDAVYYTYNSANLVTSVRSADAIHSYTTWYGTDRQGRVDSVWTKLSGQGLLGPFGMHFRAAPTRPATADIRYTYTKTGQVATMSYPPVGVLVNYAYNHRKFLDSMVATQGGANVFREILVHDPTGQITSQIWQHGTDPRRRQDYDYDWVHRLTSWNDGPDTVGLTPPTTYYNYDSVGNRTGTLLVDKPLERNTYVTGRNQLSTHVAVAPFGSDFGTQYDYDANGAVIRRQRYESDHESGAWKSSYGSDQMDYGHNGLMRRFQARNENNEITADWRYRYSASGEREQKRLYARPEDDGHELYPWVYYLLGGTKEQLAVYHARQTSNSMCGGEGRRVYVYPVEFLTYGNGGTANILTKSSTSREYVIADHLGSVRSVVDQSAAVTASQDYEPFGEPLAVTGVRKSYIDRERDRESASLNCGVRQMEGSRFMSVDRMWEKYRGLSPYSYGSNNPIVGIDPSGDTINLKLTPGTPRYLRDSVSAYLDRLRSKSGFARMVIDALVKSRNYHDIMITTEPLSSSRPENANAENGKGAGSTIYFNPLIVEKRADGEINPELPPDEIALFTELGHSYRDDQGIHDSRPWTMSVGFHPESPISEDEYVVHGVYENIVRRDYGLPPRTTYNGAHFISLDISTVHRPGVNNSTIEPNP